MTKRILFIFGLLLIGSKTVPAADSHPNMVVIMADDIGWECLGCYGSKQYSTPNLDRLATSGMRFENAHSQPICTPSRVQLMTGIYNNRNYIRFGLLDPSAMTFANSLRAAGYDTCIGGKWQLLGGFDAPRRFGFNRYCLWQLTRRPSRYPNPGLEIDGIEVDFKNGEFGPDVVSDYLVDFIKRNRDEPFLVYYPMIAPHWPFVPTPDHPDWDPTMWRDKKSEPGGYKDDKYWDAMVRHTDKMVGKILDAVDQSGKRDDTLIIWTGDNGTYQSVTSRFRNRDIVGGKGTTVDAGTHVGFLACWPGVIPPASVSDELVDFTDVYATLLDAAKIKSPKIEPLDGVSLMPAFRGERRTKDHIYCWYERNGNRKKAKQYVHDGRFKLYTKENFFDVLNDPDEKVNLLEGDLSNEANRALQLLRPALAKHTDVTKLADPIQTQKQAHYAEKK